MRKKLYPNINKALNKLFLTILSTGLLFGCSKNPNDTGTEYAPQMYNSIGYEPYNQILDTNREEYNSNPHNPSKMNMRLPVQGTIARKYFAGHSKNELAKDIMVYNIPADSINMSARILTNPIPLSKEVLEDGKVLYERYCKACHGEGGLGDGKVADQYKGVANLVAKAKVVTEGHIFHVITHGKGRMWPHGSQVNPDERWKIVHYVKSLGK